MVRWQGDSHVSIAGKCPGPFRLHVPKMPSHPNTNQNSREVPSPSRLPIPEIASKHNSETRSKPTQSGAEGFLVNLHLFGSRQKKQ